MSIKQIFKSTMPNITYLFRNGKPAIFDAYGKFMTEVSHEIAELELEIRNGHQIIFRDPNELQIDTTLQDKIREAQKAATLQIMEEHNKAEAIKGQVDPQAGAQSKDGNSTSSQVGTVGGVGAGVQSAQPSAAQLLGITSSATLGALAAGSTSAASNPSPVK